MPKTEIKPEMMESVYKKIKYNCASAAGENQKRRTAYCLCKRIFDIIFSILCIILLIPFMLVISILIKFDSKGPVFFKQARVGKDGEFFVMYKFRSMCDDAENQLHKLKQCNEKDGPVFKIYDDPRVTRFGRVIRRTSIDELPQLFNILRGEMSFVGPRPPLPREVVQYNSHQLQRISVTPGLTCYWQISGRSNLSFDDWVELDLKYIRERGIRTDLKILLQTLPAVLKREGAY